MIIGNLDTNKQILIIAEIGNNHEGNFSLAKEMIGLAAKAGAHAVKFQTIVPEKLVSATQKKRIQQLKKFQLSYNEFAKLSHVAQQEGVLFLSTPFDLESADFLEPLVPAYKIASGDNNFYPLIDRIAQTGKPIILSSGITEYNAIKKIKEYIFKIWRHHNIQQELAILHCVASYPTPLQEANLRAIEKLKTLGVTVGYSDHTIGIEAAVIAVALGARIIEKHFTISRNYSNFHDHQLSADPQELTSLVQRICEVTTMLGNNTKNIQKCEKNMVKKIRRSIVSAHDLPQGHCLQLKDLNWVRPAEGLPPGQENKILGKTLKRPLSSGEPIVLSDLK